MRIFRLYDWRWDAQDTTLDENPIAHPDGLVVGVVKLAEGQLELRVGEHHDEIEGSAIAPRTIVLELEGDELRVRLYTAPEVNDEPAGEMRLKAREKVARYGTEFTGPIKQEEMA